MSQGEYTVEQFRRAHFALVPFQRKALRVDRSTYLDDKGIYIEIEAMAAEDSGWIPCLYPIPWESVEDRPPMKLGREEYDSAVARVERMVGDFTTPATVCAAFAIEAGITVEPAPVTAADEMRVDLRQWTGDLGECVDKGLAKWLADRGWTKTTGDDR